MGTGVGAGTGRERGRGETRGRTRGENADGSGDGSQSSSGDRNGDKDRNGGGDGIREGGVEAKKRKQPHKNCRRNQALSFRTRHHLCGQGVALAGNRQFRLQSPVSVHTRIAPRG